MSDRLPLVVAFIRRACAVPIGTEVHAFVGGEIVEHTPYIDALAPLASWPADAPCVALHSFPDSVALEAFRAEVAAEIANTARTLTPRGLVVERDRALVNVAGVTFSPASPALAPIGGA